MIQRNLDGVYFRVKRDDKYENVCFSDMTPEEQDGFLEGRDVIWLCSMCKILAKTIRDIGDQFDLVAG